MAAVSSYRNKQHAQSLDHPFLHRFKLIFPVVRSSGKIVRPSKKLACSDYEVLNGPHFLNGARSDKDDDEKTLIDDKVVEIVCKDTKTGNSGEELDIQPLHTYEKAKDPPEKDFKPGKGRGVVEGLSLGTSASEKTGTYPRLRTTELLRDSSSLCPGCQKKPQVMQQVLPADTERTGRELLVFRQRAKTDVWVDVAVDVTPKLVELSREGYRSFEKGEAENRDDLKEHRTDQLAHFDCTSCGRYKFRYEMKVLKENIGQVNGERKDPAGGKGRLLFKVKSLECAENPKSDGFLRGMVRALFGGK